MDRLSSLMARVSLLWLLAGALAGAAMMIDEALPGAWRVWLGPTHGHMLFVGWFAQFALGIGFWLLPRRRSPERPLGYDERLALGAAAMLNLGLLLRVAVEPLQRAGHDGAWTTPLLGCSGALQAGAFALFVTQLWPRLGPRAIRAAVPATERQEPRHEITKQQVDRTGPLGRATQGGFGRS
jgi:hypothetical protein